MTPALPDLPAVEVQIVEMTNAFRAEEKLGAVKPNRQLENAARAYAEYLARTDKFAHDADGRQPAERVRTAGYQYCQVAENLASSLDSRGFTNSELSSQTMEGWINSPGHRRNLLAPHVTDIGVAVVRAPDKHPKFISVQLFGRPQSAQYTFQVSNTAKAEVTYEFAGESHEIKPGYAARHGACLPGEIVFTAIAKKTGNVKGTFEASDGQVYVVSANRGGGLEVSVEQKRTLSRSSSSKPSASSRPASAPPRANFIPLPERAPAR